MHCDEQRHDPNVHEYVIVLSDIAILSLGSDADFIMFGGDFNADLHRGMP